MAAERGKPCLQDAGVLVSRRAHGAHHRAPFEGNYCIVSGIWNPVLDQVRGATTCDATLRLPYRIPRSRLQYM